MSVEARHHVRAALAPHADKLVPSGVDDLVNILGDELSNMTESQIKEVVGYRLGGERFKHYLRQPGQSGTPSTPGQPGVHVPPSSPEAGIFVSANGTVYRNLSPQQVANAIAAETRQAEATQRMFEAARQAQFSGQIGHAVGLRGEWAQRGNT